LAKTSGLFYCPWDTHGIVEKKKAQKAASYATFEEQRLPVMSRLQNQFHCASYVFIEKHVDIIRFVSIQNVIALPDGCQWRIIIVSS